MAIKRTDSNLGVAGSCHICFYLLVFKVTLGVIRCACISMACVLKTAGWRVKWIEIWESAVVVIRILGTFVLLACHFGVIRCTCLKMACNSKTAFSKQNYVRGE